MLKIYETFIKTIIRNNTSGKWPPRLCWHIFSITVLHKCGGISLMQRVIYSFNTWRVVWAYSHKPVTSQEKKSRRVKSQNLGGQFRSPKRERIRPWDDYCSNWTVLRALWHVTSFCWNHMSSKSMSSSIGCISGYENPVSCACCQIEVVGIPHIERSLRTVAALFW